jgi:hypothetical protein
VNVNFIRRGENGEERKGTHDAFSRWVLVAAGHAKFAVAFGVEVAGILGIREYEGGGGRHGDGVLLGIKEREGRGLSLYLYLWTWTWTWKCKWKLVKLSWFARNPIKEGGLVMKERIVKMKSYT